MFRHILLPTDGSALSKQAVKACMLFARGNGAGVVGMHVIPPIRPDLLEAWVHHDPHHAQRRKLVLEKLANDYLGFVRYVAVAHNVPCVCKVVHDEDPCAGIVKTAIRMRSDLIYMAAHGGQGTAHWLGGVTLQVLNTSRVSVLVHKASGAPR